MKHHHCNAIGCIAEISDVELFCKAHERLLHSDVRRILARTYKPGRRPSKIFTVTLDRAREEMFYTQTNGHHPPAAESFEWGDEPAHPEK